MPLLARVTASMLDASLITGIDPPPEVESALAAINTAHNQVSSDISLAQAAADQKIVQSKRAVEIETLQSAGGSGAARSRWPAQLGATESAARRRYSERLCAQRAARRFTAKASRSTWRRNDE